MHETIDFKTQNNHPKLQSIVMIIHLQAYSCQGDNLALLALLRLLEGLHRDIRDSLLLKSLPNDRQALYALLQNIEENGGWSFIPRMELRSLLANLAESSLTQSEPDKNTESLVKRDVTISQLGDIKALNSSIY